MIELCSKCRKINKEHLGKSVFVSKFLPRDRDQVKKMKNARKNRISPGGKRSVRNFANPSVKVKIAPETNRQAIPFIEPEPRIGMLTIASSVALSL